MELEQVKQDIENWIINFVEVPHPALGGFPPCPFARQARIKRSFEVYLGTDPYYDLKNRARYGMGNQVVIIYVYNPQEWPHEIFAASIESANTEHLLHADILALEDHPDDVENVNGVIMNQGQYAMALVQSLSDLNAKAKIMANKGFYDAIVSAMANTHVKIISISWGAPEYAFGLTSAQSYNTLFQNIYNIILLI